MFLSESVSSWRTVLAENTEIQVYRRFPGHLVLGDYGVTARTTNRRRTTLNTRNKMCGSLALVDLVWSRQDPPFVFANRLGRWQIPRALRETIVESVQRVHLRASATIVWKVPKPPVSHGFNNHRILCHPKSQSRTPT